MEHNDQMIVRGKTEQINKNVWKLNKDGCYYSVKHYDSSSTLMKVTELHRILHSLSFPYIVPVIPSDHELYFIQPWLTHAKPVDFKKQSERTASLEALVQLHETNASVDWSANPYLRPYALIRKWENRLCRFQEIGPSCEAIIGKDAVNDILIYATNALRIVRETYRSDEEQTILHGDVVHHNILMDDQKVVRLIDFDLACVGPSGTEIALWMHRVLPNMDYNLKLLMNEQPLLQKLNKSSLSLLLYPNELLREWLYYFTLSKSAQAKQIKNMTSFTESALLHWPKLWYNVERIKK